jgi:large subunit ribosomal protein L9
MKIVLLENVDNLGIVGDVKEVTDGYARNFLIPQKLAVRSGDKEAKILLKNITKKREEAKTEIVKLKENAKKIDNIEIEFKEKVNKKGSLFKAISVVQISERLKIDKKYIQMQQIKELGKHKVKINFGHDIKVIISVNVIEEINKKEKLNNNKKEQ